MLQRFYSKPERENNHPYYLVNIKDVNFLRKTNYKHCIVDCGIYDIVKHPTHKHTEQRLIDWKNLTVERGLKVVPDCPSLLYEFDIEIDFSNTEYSKELLLELYDPSDETQMPVIQCEIHKNGSGYEKSLKEYVNWFKRNYDDPEWLGSGSVCKSGNQLMTLYVMHYIKKHFPRTWIHAFGLKLNHLYHVWRVIDSYDSTAWTFPDKPFKKADSMGAKNKQERIDFFERYKNKINAKYNDQMSLLEFEELIADK